MGNRFNARIEGTRIQHTMGPVTAAKVWLGQK